MQSRTRSQLAIAIAITLLPATALAQEQETYQQSPESVLEGRDRENLHAGEDPLKLRGVDQGPDGIRSGTPLLQRADVSVAMVDADALLERRLAMYSGAARFDAPVATRSELDRGAESAELAPRSAPDEPDPAEEPSSGKYAFIGTFAVACGLAAHFFTRGR
jgi:hypothetical protein